jgi:alginate O-acetyltransferase complex protein AlgJ
MKTRTAAAFATSAMQKGVIAFFVVVLCAPIVMTAAFVILKKEAPAKVGTFIDRICTIKETVPQVPPLTLRSWLDRSFQDQAGNWFNHKYFLRKAFVLCNNQLYYECFEKSYMLNQTIVVGKERSLYEEYYVRDYCGMIKPFGRDSAEALVKEIRDVQSGFEKHGVTFVVLITPSKPSVYPEYIPDDYMKARKKIQRDYDNLVTFLKQYRIQYIDGREITLDARRTNAAPVFCRGSTHWNSLGALPTVDSLLYRIGELRDCVPPMLYVEALTVDEKPQGSDADLAKGLHLLFPPLAYVVPHPVIRAARASRAGSSGRTCKGTVAVIGGSFCDMVLDILEKNGMYDSIDFYYYFRTSLRTWPHDGRRESAFSAGAIDWDKDFFTKDAVVLEINEAGLPIGHVQLFLSEALKHL